MENIDRKKILIGATALALYGAGVATGYFTVKLKFKKLYEDFAEQEISEAKKYYSVLHKKAEYSDPVALAEPIFEEVMDKKYKDLAKNYQEEPVVQKEEEKQEVLKSAEHFVSEESEDDGWDYEDQLAEREETKAECFVIHYDEFAQNEPDHEQFTLTYYEGDGLLTDETDKPIENEENIIGKDTLKFGFGSKDNNTVYIRNLGSETDFEVVRSRGSYSEEVLGFIEHGNHIRVKHRKFRLDE